MTTACELRPQQTDTEKRHRDPDPNPNTHPEATEVSDFSSIRQQQLASGRRIRRASARQQKTERMFDVGEGGLEPP